MTTAEFIKKYSIIERDGKVGTHQTITDKESFLQELTARKADILAYFAAEKAEQAAKEAATVEFYIVDWEAHLVSVDTRYDLEEQFAKIAASYNVSIETVRKGYVKETKTETTVDTVNDDAIYETARETGEPQVLRSYMSDGCLDNLEDCSFDAVTVWAMPDGRTKQTHTHCH